MEKKKLEILAPAGSFESLKAAVHAGADAVYMVSSPMKLVWVLHHTHMQ